MRCDLHAYTRATDGHSRDSLRDMALAARALGLDYIAITEHSRHLTVAHGLNPLRLARQCEEIDRLNAELDGITLLNGIEVDILENGSLDLPDEAWLAGKGRRAQYACQRCVACSGAPCEALPTDRSGRVRNLVRAQKSPTVGKSEGGLHLIAAHRAPLGNRSHRRPS